MSSSLLNLKCYKYEMLFWLKGFFLQYILIIIFPSNSSYILPPPYPLNFIFVCSFVFISKKNSSKIKMNKKTLKQKSPNKRKQKTPHKQRWSLFSVTSYFWTWECGWDIQPLHSTKLFLFCQQISIANSFLVRGWGTVSPSSS